MNREQKFQFLMGRATRGSITRQEGAELAALMGQKDQNAQTQYPDQYVWGGTEKPPASKLVPGPKGERNEQLTRGQTMNDWLKAARENDVEIERGTGQE